MSIEQGAKLQISDRKKGLIYSNQARRLGRLAKEHVASGSNPKDLKFLKAAVKGFEDIEKSLNSNKKERIPGEKIKYIVEFEENSENEGMGSYAETVYEEIEAINDIQAEIMARDLELQNTYSDETGSRERRILSIYPGHFEIKIVKELDGKEREHQVVVKDEYED